MNLDNIFALYATHKKYGHDSYEGLIFLGENRVVVCISQDQNLLRPIKQMLEKGPVDSKGFWSASKHNKIRKIFPEYDDSVDYVFMMMLMMN